MTGGRRRRRLGLNAEELKLWRLVTKAIEPLPGRALPAESPAPPAPREEEPAPAAAPPPEPAAKAGRRNVTSPPPLAPLEPKVKRRLARGTAPIEARIDLHGLRQDEARRRLLAFLVSAQAADVRMVLVITGKGRPDAEADRFTERERGVLRRMLPLWLEDAELRHLIVGFESAHLTHGGEGAFYVRLRRRRG